MITMDELEFTKKISLRWSDLDPNFHVRHSVYYDFGAQQRIEILHALGLTPAVMMKNNFGPVIFREECVFRREIRLADEVTISAALLSLAPDASRWTIQHELHSADHTLLARLTVDGAWIDTHLRKLLSPVPELVQQVFQKIPRKE